jgi:hypothetical protein
MWRWRIFKVIDLGSWLAAPTTATVLADLGADVVKIEPPPLGDQYRFTQFIPGFPKADDNYAWLLTNCSERSTALDLKQEGGYVVLLDLVAAADVLHELPAGRTGAPEGAIRRSRRDSARVGVRQRSNQAAARTGGTHVALAATAGIP